MVMESALASDPSPVSEETLTRLATLVSEKAENAARFVVGIAGPPASGKSTLAAALVERLGARAALVPMDGYHFDDVVLKAKGLSHCKGAPETFDFAGFASLLKRIRANEPEIAVPVFDRSMELARAGAALVTPETPIVVVEGNYLLLDEEPWRDLGSLFDLTVFLDVERDELERRMVERWRFHGREEAAARHWIATNDMPNIDRVRAIRRPADLVV